MYALVVQCQGAADCAGVWPLVSAPVCGCYLVLCLQDGTAKMSKSAENDASRINLTDTPDIIRQKVRVLGCCGEKGLW